MLTLRTGWGGRRLHRSSQCCRCHVNEEERGTAEFACAFVERDQFEERDKRRVRRAVHQLCSLEEEEEEEPKGLEFQNVIARLDLALTTIG